MPGTIQVSVLEFRGLPSTSPSIVLKVALGKKEYQTSDTRDFSFPLTSIRDNLVVTFQDAEGNEIAHTVIQTISIVEKVYWNDNFHLVGGGHVHLQLQFILSDEERNRIRSMREAAMKRKQVSVSNLIPEQSEIASSESDSVVSSPQAKQIVSEALSKSEYSGPDVAAKSTSVSSEDDHAYKPECQVPLEKTPRNVRKLVSVFEGSLAQDLKSPVKLSAVKPEEKEVGKRSYLKDSGPKDAIEAAGPISGRHKKLFVARQLKTTKKGEHIDSGRIFVDKVMFRATNRLKNPTSTANESNREEPGSTEWSESSVDLDRPSIAESVDHNSGRAYSFGLSAERQDSDGTSYVQGRRKIDSAEISAQVASSGKSKLLDYREEEHFHFEKSGMWIFPSDRKHLCITTAGKRVMNLLGSRKTEARSPQKKKSSSTSGHVDEISEHHGSEHEKKKDHNKTYNPRKSSSESSSGDASRGLVAQAIKVAVVVGFGLLVFLTRQREPRKSKKDTNDLLFETSEFMNEQI